METPERGVRVWGWDDEKDAVLDEYSHLKTALELKTHEAMFRPAAPELDEGYVKSVEASLECDRNPEVLCDPVEEKHEAVKEAMREKFGKLVPFMLGDAWGRIPKHPTTVLSYDFSKADTRGVP